MKYFSFILLLLLPILMSAQEEGTIIYTETISFSFEAPEGMEDLFKSIPKSRSSEKKLIFKDQMSLYIVHESSESVEENEMEPDMGENVIRINFVQPDNKTYSDMAAGKIVAQQELMGKAFLIQDDIKKYNWKVTSERRQILEYQCMKATAQDGENLITAWFTPQISLGLGPDQYNGLPGAILMIELNDGDREIVAKSVSMEPVNVADMIIPTKGKKVDRKKYEKIEKEKMEEQESFNGGTGARVIIRN
ncbi:MAG: GLPGLI family protein [Saprospiraceae bacterium]